jgi:hypothetical protein
MTLVRRIDEYDARSLLALLTVMTHNMAGVLPGLLLS